MSVLSLLDGGVLITAGALISHAFGLWIGQARLLLCLYLAHVAAALFLAASKIIEAPDSHLYDTVARWHLDYWSGELAFGPNDAPSKSGYPLLLAWTYRLLGERHLLYGALVNALLATLAIALLARTCQIAGMARAATVVKLGFLPAFLLWAGLPLREAGVWLLTALILYAGACAVSGKQMVAVIWGVLGVAGLSTFRGSLSAVVLVGVGIGAFLGRKRATGFATASASLVALAGIFFALQTGIAGSLTDQNQLNASRAALSRSGSGFAATAYTGPLSAIAGLPVTIPRILFGPYPTAWFGIGIYAPIVWAAWIAVLWCAFRGFRSMRGNRSRWLWVPPAGMLVIILAITSGNWGTMVRIREQVTLCILPLAAVWIDGRGERRAQAAAAASGRSRRRTRRPRRQARTRPRRHMQSARARAGGGEPGGAVTTMSLTSRSRSRRSRGR